MAQIPENVRQILVQLVPASIINEIVCYVFYDNHPRDDKSIDITVLTKLGEVREYFQRDLISSVLLARRPAPWDMRILRNSRCQLFYLVLCGDELTVLSRKDKLQIHHQLNDVEKYEISDSLCSGQGLLKVVTKNNAIPLVPDDNFENFECQDFSPSLEAPLSDEMSPIITHLNRKITEAKYSVQCNEKTYKEFVNIRQLVAFSMYKKMHPNLDDSVFKDNPTMMGSAVKIIIQKPSIKCCNRKLVIVNNICNKNDIALDDVHILLHGTTRESIEYTTKIFEKTNTPPFWNETKSQTINPNTEYAVVAVIDIEEIKYNVISKIEFDGVMVYRILEKECILPIHDVNISSLDTMGENFDVLCSEPLDSNTMLAVLASTQKTDLILRHLKSPDTNTDIFDDQNVLTTDLFCKYLKMEQVEDNIVMYRKSPYHVLNGVLVILDKRQGTEDQLAVTVHSRSQSQVLALIHHLHDSVPYTIVATTPTHKITAKNNNILPINNETTRNTPPSYNLSNYTTSILNRTSLIIEYLDNSMIKMSESKDPVVKNKIGTEIDLFAIADAGFQEFKRKMREQAAFGVKICEDVVDVETMPMYDEMCVD